MNDVSRRRWLQTALVVPAAVTAATEPVPAPKPKPARAAREPLVLPPVQPGPPYLLAGPQFGHVGPHEARVWVRATAPGAWAVKYARAEEPDAWHTVAGPELTGDSGQTGIAVLTRLAPATTYLYQIIYDGREQLARPLPTFTTAPPAGTDGRLRVAFGSCVGHPIAAAAPTWAELAQRRFGSAEQGGFDLLLMLGDNHYADTTDLHVLRTYYTAHRLSPGWRQLAATTPIYAIWDDHDYGPNNSDGTEAGKDQSLRAFREYWANPSAGQAEDPGCYFTFRRGAVQFFLLDGRYHRTPNATPDGPGKTMLGKAQLAWLKHELKASEAKVKIIANGSEWQSLSTNDSWAAFRTERDALLGWMEAEKIEGVLFLSGDRHFSAAYHVLNRWVEVTAGPVGSGNAKLGANAERIFGHDDGRLWGVIEVDTTVSPPRVAAEIWQTAHSRRLRREFTWAQLHGREPIAKDPWPG
jgi:alkaline phosphatase D